MIHWCCIGGGSISCSHKSKQLMISMLMTGTRSRLDAFRTDLFTAPSFRHGRAHNTSTTHSTHLITFPTQTLSVFVEVWYTGAYDNDLIDATTQCSLTNGCNTKTQPSARCYHAFTCTSSRSPEFRRIPSTDVLHTVCMQNVPASGL